MITTAFDIALDNEMRMSIVDPAPSDGRRFNVNNTADRQEMLQRAKAMVDNPSLSPLAREKAQQLIVQISALDRKPGSKAKKVRDELTRYAAALTAATLWSGLFGLKAWLASNRINECWDELSGGQVSICIRHAIEGRDEAIILALGGPALIAIGFIAYRYFKSFRS